MLQPLDSNSSLLQPSVVKQSSASTAPLPINYLSTLTGHTKRVTSLTADAEGNLLSGSYDATIRLWDPTTGNCSFSLPAYDMSSVMDLQLLPNNRLASAHAFNDRGEKGVIMIWNLSNRQGKAEELHNSFAASLTFLEKRDLLFTGFWDGTIQIWNFDKNREEFFGKQSGHVVALAVAPEEQAPLFSAQNNEILQWNLAGKSSLFGSHSKSVEVIAISPNGKLLASGSDDTTIKIWDISTKTLLHTLSGSKGHYGNVGALAFLSDELLATGSSDCSIKFWDLMQGGDPLYTIDHAHSSEVTCLSPLPGEILASGSQDFTIKLWSS